MRQIGNDANLAGKLLDELKTAIVNGELVAGSLYSVHDLAERLGVSRTPVREALIQLAERGMVRFERNRGVRILQTSLHDLEEVFAIRLLLEVPATYRAVTQRTAAWVRDLDAQLKAMRVAADRHDEATFMAADRRFHEVINSASGNVRLARYIDSLRDMVLLRGSSTVDTSRTLADILAEHEEIFARIEAGEAAAAAESMRAHLLHTGRLLISQEAAASGDALPPVSLEWTAYPGVD
ncbi:DNA-binding GntR family transcriptional regulator [Amycolatopsis endophytica]|uniref:DNA-binding GntR family transcriptional regulator n=1 Tax=Amycolatopsis endophytica TaxID=860233 RepID=A0A853BFZ8_9PSEU|nr:GntR family transcriptional regulator [Amycolatopsis endophytica]NYI93477.1 DNA-binding GntR family transcriptional regulator [Amycolatopsis endophytica]